MPFHLSRLYEIQAWRLRGYQIRLYGPVQFSMWVTGRDARYFANYDPRMKREGIHHVVVERDDKYMSLFNEMVPEFIEKMDEALKEIGFTFGEQWR